MKEILIGLEYEGVITKDKKIVRFSEMPQDVQSDIQNRYPNPHDNYDCLAECRTEPFLLTDVRDIAFNLFQQKVTLEHLYKRMGYEVLWEECEIPIKIHKAITNEVKLKKPILTINNGQIESVHNIFDRKRGAGIHITISGLSDDEMIGKLIRIHGEISHFNESMDSFYRKNFLFRKKQNNKGENMIEYMSIGFEVPERASFNEFYQATKHFFHIFEPIVKILKS